MGLLAQVLGQLPGHRPVLAEERAVERRSAPDDRRVKTLALTPEGERLRACFWRESVEDPGPLAPLGEPRVRALCRALQLLDPGQASGRS
jgi:DNA-binding MarR family transcriptional regulator